MIGVGEIEIGIERDQGGIDQEVDQEIETDLGERRMKADPELLIIRGTDLKDQGVWIRREDQAQKIPHGSKKRKAEDQDQALKML